MHVAKLRIGADQDGLIPAGTYFERLSAAMRAANVRAAKSPAARPRLAARRFLHDHHRHA